MKNILFIIAAIICADALFSGCANPVSPTGGPKDTIPPTLLNSYPINGSINFTENSILLEFSEFVNADKLTQNLIITPKSDVKFKHLVKRNQLDIKFEEPFENNTTYSLNFFDGVTDITEKNPAVNLILAFSTGDFIDSMRVEGQIRDLMTAKESKKFLVGLYPFSDSLDYFTQSPLYFTTSNDSGKFNMSYVKSGIYKILAFEDDNRNLLLDPESEAHGFLADTVQLFSPLTNLNISTLLQNVKPLKLINHRPIGSYHEIKFNKQVNSYSISPDSLFHALTGDDKEVIRLYNPGQFNYGDSISIVLNASDSLSNTIADTLKVVFLESNRKPKEFNTSAKYQLKQFLDNPLYTINFNKPVITADPEKFVYQADTIFNLQPDSLAFNWNESKTQLKLTSYILKDSLYGKFRQALVADSIQRAIAATDSASLNTQARQSAPKMTFSILPGAFVSIENDSSERKSIKHIENFTEPTGVIPFDLQTQKESFKIQFLNSGGQVVYQQENIKKPVFRVAPGKYTVRILIDTNSDGTWSFGNLLKNEEPEQVLIHPDEIIIRENWTYEDIQISF